MGDPYPIQPVQVEPVQSAYRTICTAIPHPDSVPLLEQLRRIEPLCMEGQPPIVWDRAEGINVYDAYGNRWLDFSSGVLITNAGHGQREMVEAITRMAQRPLLTTYCFPHAARGELTALLQAQAPRQDDKVMLLSTGSEADELCIKLARQRGRNLGKKKPVFVTFANAFHGRTLGSQFAGGIAALKEWIGYTDEHFVNVPFPDGVRCKPQEMTFDAFEKALAQQGVSPQQVCGVMTESYQGGNSSFAPVEYIQQLRRWCDRYQAVLIMDEVQAGFGRTGKFWAFEHYGIVPDLISCGKGISGSLPLSAVIGRRELMDQFPPGSMTSTHSGNAVCCAAATASLGIILRDRLTENAERLGREVFQPMAAEIQKKYASVVLAHHGKGLVASLHCVKPGTSEADGKLAWSVIAHAVRMGLMMFAPVGYGGASVKLCPPLCIGEAAVKEGMQVLDEAFARAIKDGR